MMAKLHACFTSSLTVFSCHQDDGKTTFSRHSRAGWNPVLLIFPKHSSKDFCGNSHTSTLRIPPYIFVSL
jgi:hypothetical protein